MSTDNYRAGVIRERLGLLLAIAIVVIHAAFRIDATALWLDEGYTLGATNNLWASLTRTHGTMGLYYVIMTGWAWFGEATWWLRLPSTLFAIATLVVLRPLARRIGGPDMAAIVLPMAAFMPMFQAKAIEARGFSLLTLITCTCWYVLVRGMDAFDDRSSRRWFLLLVPLSIAGVFSHGLFVVHIAALGATIVIGPSPVSHFRRYLPAAVTTVGVTYSLHSLGASNIGTMVLGGPLAMARTTVNAYLPGAALPRLVLGSLFVAGTVLITRRLILSRGRLDRAMTSIPVAMSVVPCVVLAIASTVEPRYSPRYLAPIGLGIAMVIGWTLLRVERAVAPFATRSVARRAMGAISLLVLCIAGFGLAKSPHGHSDDWRGVAALVADRSRPTDAIVFANRSIKEPMQHRVPFEAAWREVDTDHSPTVLNPPRPLGEVRRFDDSIPADQVSRTATRHERIWVIEHQASGLDQTSAFVAALTDNGFEVAETWTRHNQISLVLLTSEAASVDDESCSPITLQGQC